MTKKLPILIFYTTYFPFQNWEILILSKLQWNIAAVTGFDYIDHIIDRVSWGTESPLIRRHAATLVGVCYTGKLDGCLSFLLMKNSLVIIPVVNRSKGLIEIERLGDFCIENVYQGLLSDSCNYHKTLSLDWSSFSYIYSVQLHYTRHFVSHIFSMNNV